VTRPKKSLHIITKNPTTSLHFLFNPEMGLHFYFTFGLPNKAEVSNAEEQLTRNYFGGRRILSFSKAILRGLAFFYKIQKPLMPNKIYTMVTSFSFFSCQ